MVSVLPAIAKPDEKPVGEYLNIVPVALTKPIAICEILRPSLKLNEKSVVVPLDNGAKKLLNCFKRYVCLIFLGISKARHEKCQKHVKNIETLNKS